MQKLLFFALVLFTGNMAAQTRVDSVRLDKLYYGPLDLVLDEIGTQYQVKFVFERPELHRINIEKRPFDQPLLRFLDLVCRPNDLKVLRLDDGGLRILGAYENPATDVLTKRSEAVHPPSKQKNLTITGLITDRATGEALPFVTVRVLGAAIGTTANVDGQFTLLNVPSDTSSLFFSYVGYAPLRIFLQPDAPFMDFKVTMQSGTLLGEVVIVAEKEALLKASEQVSMLKMTPSKLATLPSLGERDIFRSFQLMPGISAANEQTSGLYVRGGTPDQVLTLYDGFTVYNVDHLFGFFSAFNSNSIKDVQLYKGVFDAKYGGRLASVVEITGKDGNNHRFNAGGDLSLLSANLWMEKPFGEKFTTIVTARRSWKGPLYEKIFDRFSGESQSSDNPFGNRFGNAKVASYFYDVNAKATWKPNKRDVFSLSVYNGADKLDNSIRPQLPSGFGGGGSLNLEITDLTNWGNTGASLKWSSKWSERLYANTLLSYSNYFSKRDRSTSGSFERDGETQDIRRGTLENNSLYDFSAKTDWAWKFIPGQQLEFGLGATQNNITYTYAQSDTATLLDRGSRGLTATAYVQDKADFFKEKLVITPGLRVSHFSPTGQLYYEPRANVVLRINDRIKLKGATGLYYQFAKRVIREDILSGSRDFWVLTDGEKLPVASSKQYVAGFSWENTGWLFDAEAYYKTLDGLTEYSLRFTPSGFGQIDYAENFFSGTGTARGIDLLLQKKYGRFNGWLGYTLGDTRQNYPVYGPSDFYASNDVTHEFKAVSLYKWRRWDFSATWIYASGKPYTAPEGGYQITLLDGTTQDFLNVSAKNAYRLPAYHRFDLAATYNFHFGSSPATFGLSVFNLYNRKNVWYKEFEILDNEVIATDVHYLGITPNLTLGVKLR